MSFAKLASAVALVAFLSRTASAHMEISEPVPFRSKFAGDSGNTDYSMTAPLNKDGSNYPCKGYHVDLGASVSATQTITAGQDMTVKMAGSAVHNGGSCQFSLSYDKGATFGAIHSVVGNCPIDTSYTFKVPDGVPAGKDVLFAWTWFNKSGNREMYMNCAPVNVDSSGSGITVPQMFQANVFGEGTCTTIEGQDVDFANPAGNVNNCPADKLITPDKTVTFGSAGAAPPAPPPAEPTAAPPTEPTAAPPTEPTAAPPTEPTAAPPTEPTDDCPEEEPVPTPEPTDDCPEEQEPTTAPPPPSSSSTPPAPPAPTSSTPSTPPPPPSTGGSCTGGQIKCGADGKTWSMCANGAYVNMGSVAAGTTCSNGQITRRSAFSRRHNA